MGKVIKHQELYPFEMDYLPEDVHEKAVKELNEMPEQRTEELRKFREMLSKADKTLEGIDFHDDFLWLFLRHTKHNAPKAIQYLRNFIKFRRNYSHFFQSVDEDLLNKSPSTECFSILPKRTPDGCAVILIEAGKWDPDEFPLEDFERMFFFVILQSLRCPMTQINGFKIIHDFKGISLKQVQFCTPQNVYLEYHIAMRCIPGRYKEIHFVNGSILFTVFWSVAKYLFTKKMKQRIFNHSTPEDLLNFFPADILLVQWGGNMTDYHDENMLKKLNKEHGRYPMGGPPNYF